MSSRADYKCVLCGKVVEREFDDTPPAEIPSYCDDMDEMSVLVRIGDEAGWHPDSKGLYRGE